jgi:hypothetical protein
VSASRRRELDRGWGRSAVDAGDVLSGRDGSADDALGPGQLIARGASAFDRGQPSVDADESFGEERLDPAVVVEPVGDAVVGGGDPVERLDEVGVTPADLAAEPTELAADRLGQGIDPTGRATVAAFAAVAGAAATVRAGSRAGVEAGVGAGVAAWALSRERFRLMADAAFR